jgi:hypothetical protein
LLCLTGALTSQGCILPQTENVIPTLPNTNTAPRIVARSPQDLIVTAYEPPNGATTCTAATDFSVTVEDDDIISSDGGTRYRDTLTPRWFIDGVGREGDTVPGTPVDPGSSASRLIAAPNNFPSKLGFKADSNRHLVEVYVTDGSFGEDVLKPKPTLEQDQAYVATLAWFVQIERCQ